MKKILFLAPALCCLLALSGCSPSQKQTSSQMGADSPPVQEKTITGPFGEQIPEPEKTSPFEQSQETQHADAGLQSETSGALKPPSLTVIDGRIAAYGKKFARWNELNTPSDAASRTEEQTGEMTQCYQKMQRILADYNTLRTAVEGGDRSDVAANSIYNMKMQNLQAIDIDFVEGACGQLLNDSAATRSTVGAPGAKTAGLPVEEEIASLAAAKDYKGVTEAWLKIPAGQQELISLKTRMLYADALIYLQKEEEAADVYQQMVSKMESSGEQATDLISLRKTLADLYIAVGKFPEAQLQYVRISKDYLALSSIDSWAKIHLAILGGNQKENPELADYSGLIRNYLGYYPEQDGYKIVWDADKFLRAYPGSTVASNVETIKNKATEAADKWFNGVVAEVDRLAGEKKFQEAIAKIKAQRTDIINDQQVDLLNAKNDELVLAEAVDQETAKMTKLQELDQKWNNGMLLVKSGRYDEAISVFNDMMETDYAKKADEKIAEISALAAKDDRRKAADLFIRFTKTADLESKKKLLIESRRLLKNILVKYPRADITDKVLTNIQRVEQEMNAIDPQLISTADSQAESSQQPQQGTGEQPNAVTPEDDAFAPQPPIVETPVKQ
jgi:hypothetical protein